VEAYPLVYNSRDTKLHNKREAINNVWDDVAAGLKVKGKQITSEFMLR